MLSGLWPCSIMCGLSMAIGIKAALGLDKPSLSNVLILFGAIVIDTVYLYFMIEEISKTVTVTDQNESKP